MMDLAIEAAAPKKGIIRGEAEDAEWPRELVKAAVQARDVKIENEEDVIIRPKVI